MGEGIIRAKSVATLIWSKTLKFMNVVYHGGRHPSKTCKEYVEKLTFSDESNAKEFHWECRAGSNRAPIGETN